MPSAAFMTLGCKVNQYETQKILESFEATGFEIVPIGGTADVVVINSCSVTSDAERKSRYAARRAARQHPGAKVVVTGCAAQMSINREETFEDVDLVVPNPQKLQTIERVLETFSELGISARRAGIPKIRNLGTGRTRATLKIQDGCDVMCSYCSIPYTRPGMRSRPWEEVLEEAQGLHVLGYHEVILTGVLIGSYGIESGSGGPDFEDLVEIIAKRSGIERIRISSIEMHHVTDRLIQLILDGLVVPHLHIPLQCGDSQVLRDMNRRYDQSAYLALCERLQREIPDLCLTTDVLVGFPTETAERFQSSVTVFEQVGYHSAHVFSFSPRWGTPADRWGDPISDAEKTQRRMTLASIAQRTGQAFHERHLGRTMRVLFESKPDRDGLLCGTTDNYLNVKASGPAAWCGSLQPVRLDQWHDGALRGEVVAAEIALRQLVIVP